MSDLSNTNGSPKLPGDVDTTGHVWDGIEEFNNPLPRWWLYTFYLCIIWGVGYVIAYPAWPLISQATPGLLGFSTRAQVAAEIEAAEQANAAINERLVQTELTMIADDDGLATYARQKGAAVFRTYCAQCHGSGAAGVAASGYPNLLDDDWLWGGDIVTISETVRYGIRNETSDDTRYSEMPAFGELLEEDEIVQVVNFVMTLSGQTPNDASLVDAGAVVYADNCSSCHMEDGSGDPWQGAPNLADAIWLYSSDYDSLISRVQNPPFGVMPSWEGRLSEAEIRAVAAYVHGLGGGEAPPVD